MVEGRGSKNEAGGYKGIVGFCACVCVEGRGCKEKRWMAMGKCHSLNILSGSLPTPPLSFCPSFLSCLSSPHFSPSFSLSFSASLSPLLTQRSCQCLLLLIQVSNPPPVKKGGEGQAEPLEESLSESLNLLSLLSLCPSR